MQARNESQAAMRLKLSALGFTGKCNKLKYIDIN